MASDPKLDAGLSLSPVLPLELHLNPLYRLAESRHTLPLFLDPFAHRLVLPDPALFDLATGQGRRAELISRVRTRLVDDLVLEAIGLGVDLILNIAGGLDTRPYRLPIPSYVQWIEWENASVLKYKADRLLGVRPRASLMSMACDWATPAKALAALPCGRGRKVLVITEALVPAQNETLVNLIGEQLRPAQSFWIADGVRTLLPGWSPRNVFSLVKQCHRYGRETLQFSLYRKLGLALNLNSWRREESKLLLAMLENTLPR